MVRVHHLMDDCPFSREMHVVRGVLPVQRILTGLDDRYERETDTRKKMHLAEKCADTYSRLKRNQLSKTYYLRQVIRIEFDDDKQVRDDLFSYS
jgi:hypothetical protein